VPIEELERIAHPRIEAALDMPGDLPHDMLPA
jgi:hypothetical protein